MNPSVTIGLPIFNVESCIENSLQSALSQSYDDIDFVLIDDCSTDNSMQIVNHIVERSPRRERIRIIKHEINRGLGETRNTIIRNSQTQFVYFMDSDDVIEKNTIAILVGKAIAHNLPDITIANHKTVCLDGQEKAISSVETDVFLQSNNAIISYFSGHYIRVSSWNKLFSVEFLRQNRIEYIHRFHEDYFFSLQEVFYAKTILIIPDVTYTYMLRSQSITGGMKMTGLMVDRLIPVENDIKNFLDSHSVNDVIVAKKYIDLITHILYISYVVDYPKRVFLLEKYKRNMFALRFLKQNITRLSKAFIIGSRLPMFVFVSYWKYIVRLSKH